MKRISYAIKGVEPKNVEEEGIQFAELANDLANFEDLLPPPVEFDPKYHTDTLQNHLDDIISGAALIADLHGGPKFGPLPPLSRDGICIPSQV